MNFFISSAHAASGGAQQGDPMSLIVMLAIMGIFFYFFLIRPQSKRMKEHKELISSVGKNDEVLTQGGIVGKVARISEEKDFIVLALNDNHEVVIQKNAITAVLPKGTIKSL